MQVPTAASLPAVASERPQVVPQQGAASADPFGAQIGVGLAQIGKSTGEVGTEIGSIAASYANEQDQQAARAASAQSMGYANNLGFKSADGQGAPAFYAMKGQQAVAGAQPYLDALTAERNQAAATLSPRARNFYMLQTDDMLQRETARVNQFTMVQQGVASQDISVARIGAANDAAVLRYNDPAAIEESAKVIRGETFAEGQRQGWPQEKIDEQTKINLSKTYGDAVKKALAGGDVATAAKLFNLYEPQMEATAGVALHEHMRGPLLRAQAAAGVNEILGANTTVGSGKMGDAYSPGSGYYDLVHGGEGNGVNSITGASGPVQVIPSTAAAFAASAEGKGVDINSEAGARRFTAWYGDQNAAKIQSVTGQPATNAQVIAAHLLGPGGVTAIVAHPDEPISNHLTPAAIKNNPGPLPSGDLTGAQAMQTISNYYAKAAGLPSAASVAAATKIHPDFSAAADAVIAKTQGDPELQHAMIGELRSREALYNLSTKTEREGLQKSVLDTQAALESGRTDVVIPELAIRHAFEPAQADVIMGRLTEAQQAGHIYSGIKFMSPDDFATNRQAMVDSLGAKAAIPTKAALVSGVTGDPADTPNAGIQGFAQRSKELSMMDAAWTRRQTLMKADPAGYVRDEPSVVAAFNAVTANDPESLAKAVQHSMEVQRQLNPDGQPRALRTGSVDQLVHQLHSIDPKDGNAGAALDGMAKQYGSAWPSVFHDLVSVGHLNPSYQTLATMDGPGQQGARADLQAALKDQANRGEKFGSAMPEAEKPAMRMGIDAATDQFQRSFPMGASTDAMTATRASITTLATYYVEHGVPGAKAAQDAFDRIIGDKYDLDGLVRAPKTFQGQPLGSDKVLSAGYGVQARLTDADLTTAGAAGVTAAQAKNGQWVTNPDGLGVTLMVKRATGGLMPVRRSDGKYLQMSYASLPATDNTLDTQGSASMMVQ